ncbi:hypothetical protein, partial [Deinococcus saxicola]|uniref:hypothetical protein n=1 Tax=Deinococcus saxicola TaxID=249406 RepID=UPI003D135F04
MEAAQSDTDSVCNTDFVCNAVEIGIVSISTLHARNPFLPFSLFSDFQVFSTPFNRNPYELDFKPATGVKQGSAVS